LTGKTRIRQNLFSSWFLVEEAVGDKDVVDGWRRVVLVEVLLG
jgi:hypothetical protein